MAAAISAAWVSSAKWPVSKKRTVAFGIIALERFGAGRQEEGIVLAPHRQERRLVGAEIFLEGRIERDVALVVAEQIELHLVGAGPRQIEIVERISVRRNRVASATPCVYCQTVVSGLRKARSASRLSCDASFQ